jgi:lysozyme family protein
MPFVPYKVGSDPQFEKCLPDTLVQEGGYSNDPHDPGGMTMYGIIQREYDVKRRAWGLPTQWVKNISKAEYQTIYYTDYWLPYCPNLPAGLDLEFFDLAVNGGPHRAVVTLQRVLGIAADGQWGPITDEAVKTLTAASNIPKAIVNYKVQREAFYRSLGTFRYFGTDWIRRSEEIAKQAEGLEEVLDDAAKPIPPIMKG